MKILLVEDQLRGKFFKEFLEIKGYKDVTWEQNIEDAWKILKREKFELCILDVMMHLSTTSEIYNDEIEYKNGMLSGLHLLTAIRSKFGDESPKIIMYSARKQEEVDKHLPAGIAYDAYVQKSYNPNNLISTIEKLTV